MNSTQLTLYFTVIRSLYIYPRVPVDCTPIVVPAIVLEIQY